MTDVGVTGLTMVVPVVRVAGTDHKQVMTDIGIGGTGHAVAGNDHKQIMTDVEMGEIFLLTH